MQAVTVRVEFWPGDDPADGDSGPALTLVGREVESLVVRQAVGDHARLTLAFGALSPAARRAVDRSEAGARVTARDGSRNGSHGRATQPPAEAPREPLGAALAGARVRVTLTDEAGAAHLAFAGRVDAVRVVQRPRRGRVAHVAARSDSAALASAPAVRRWPAHTLGRVAAALGVVLDGDLTADGAGSDDELHLVQDGVDDWAFLARLAAEAGAQLVPEWPRLAGAGAGAADGEEPAPATTASTAAVARVRAGFGSTVHALTRGDELLAFATGYAPPAVRAAAGAYYDAAAKHDHRFRVVARAPRWLGGAAPLARAAGEAARRVLPMTDPAVAALTGAAADAGVGGAREGAVPPGGGGARAATLGAYARRLARAAAADVGASVWAVGESVRPALRAGDQVDVRAPDTPAGDDGPTGDAWDAECAGRYGLAAVVHRWQGGLYSNAFVVTPWADYHPGPAAAGAPDDEAEGWPAGARGAGAASERPADLLPSLAASGLPGFRGMGGAYGLHAAADAAGDPLADALFGAASLGAALRAAGVSAAAAAGHPAGAAGTTLGTARGVYAGLVSAVVVANVDPRGWGRVRVRFAWQGADEPCAWARVAAPAAGKGRGVGTLPEVGDEVLVAFAGADPEHPVVVGSVWNGVDTAGHRPGLQHWVTAAGHGHVMVDDKGAERQELHTPGGMVRVELTHAGPNGGPAAVVYSEGDLVLECKGTLHVRAGAVRQEVAGAVETRAGGAYTVRAAGPLTAATDATLGLSGAGAVTVRAGGVLHAHAGGAHRLTGAQVTMNPPGAAAPAVRADVGAALASVAAARAVPRPEPGRST